MSFTPIIPTWVINIIERNFADLRPTWWKKPTLADLRPDWTKKSFFENLKPDWVTNITNGGLKRVKTTMINGFLGFFGSNLKFTPASGGHLITKLGEIVSGGGIKEILQASFTSNPIKTFEDPLTKSFKNLNKTFDKILVQRDYGEKLGVKPPVDASLSKFGNRPFAIAERGMTWGMHGTFKINGMPIKVSDLTFQRTIGETALSYLAHGYKNGRLALTPGVLERAQRLSSVFEKITTPLPYIGFALDLAMVGVGAAQLEPTESSELALSSSVIGVASSATFMTTAIVNSLAVSLIWNPIGGALFGISAILGGASLGLAAERH